MYWKSFIKLVLVGWWISIKVVFFSSIPSWWEKINMNTWNYDCVMASSSSAAAAATTTTTTRRTRARARTTATTTTTTTATAPPKKLPNNGLPNRPGRPGRWRCGRRPDGGAVAEHGGAGEESGGAVVHDARRPVFLVGWMFSNKTMMGLVKEPGGIVFLCLNGCENVWVGGCNVLVFFLGGRCSFAL